MTFESFGGSQHSSLVNTATSVDAAHNASKPALSEAEGTLRGRRVFQVKNFNAHPCASFAYGFLLGGRGELLKKFLQVALCVTGLVIVLGLVSATPIPLSLFGIVGLCIVALCLHKKCTEIMKKVTTELYFENDEALLQYEQEMAEAIQAGKAQKAAAA